MFFAFMGVTMDVGFCRHEWTVLQIRAGDERDAVALEKRKLGKLVQKMTIHVFPRGFGYFSLKIPNMKVLRKLDGP